MDCLCGFPVWTFFVDSLYGLSLCIPFIDSLYIAFSTWTTLLWTLFMDSSWTLFMDFLYGFPICTSIFMDSLYRLSLWTYFTDSHYGLSHFTDIDCLYGFFYGLSVEFFCRHTLWTLWILMDFVWILHALPLSAVSIDSLSLSLYGFSLRTLSMDKLYRTLSLVLFLLTLSIDSL